MVTDDYGLGPEPGTVDYSVVMSDGNTYLWGGRRTEQIGDATFLVCERGTMLGAAQVVTMTPVE